MWKPPTDSLPGLAGDEKGSGGLLQSLKKANMGKYLEKGLIMGALGTIVMLLMGIYSDIHALTNNGSQNQLQFPLGTNGLNFPFPNVDHHPDSDSPLPTPDSSSKWTTVTMNILSDDEKTANRLPTNVLPDKYTLKIKINLPGYGAKLSEEEKFLFFGLLEIDVKVLEPVEQIVLSMKNLTIQTIHINKKGSEELIPIDSTITVQNGQMTIKTLKTVEPGEYQLFINYHGYVSEALNGLYQSKYKTKDGKEKYIALTQFEPIYARQSIPCFDEPAFKAVWKVTIVHPEGTTAISNGKELKTKSTASNWLETSFEETPRMSTYLLAFLVSDFIHIDGHTKSGVLFRIWARPDAKASLQYALDSGIKVLEFYEIFYDVKFPLKKQDMVAVPDFASGAMENWGLVTYRETALLYDPKYNTVTNKKRVLEVIAHELAHMWFGNLVTMKWWNDLWLNEGFASYVENLGIDAVDSSMQAQQTMILEDTEQAFKADALPNTFPLHSKPNSEKDIYEAFGAISYSKGLSVINMIRHAFPKAFDEGLKNYLKKHAYNNTEEDDLWRAIAEAADSDGGVVYRGQKIDVETTCRMWTSQANFPLLRANEQNGGDSFVLSQERYTHEGQAEILDKYIHPKYGFKWNIPIEYDSKASAPEWLLADEGKSIINVKSEFPPLFQANAIGFFRVLYESDYYKKIAEQLRKDHTVYTPAARMRLILDMNDFLIDKRVSYDEIFNVISYMNRETDYLPWVAISQVYKQIEDNLKGLPEEKLLKQVIRKDLSEIHSKFSVNQLIELAKEEGRHIDISMAGFILRYFCSMDEDCQKERAEMFKKDILDNFRDGQGVSDVSRAPIEILGQVMCLGIKSASQEEWDKLLELYLSESNPQVIITTLSALGCSEEEAIILRYLDETSSPGSKWIRPADFMMLVRSLSTNDMFRSKLFDYITKNWARIEKVVSADVTMMTNIIRTAASTLQQESDIETVETFRQSNEKIKNLSVWSGVISDIKKSIKWRESNFENVKRIIQQKLAN